MLTFTSMSLSHMSFIVQPAPLIMKAPIPKRASIPISGNAPAGAAMAILHPHGQNNNQEPVQSNFSYTSESQSIEEIIH